MLAIPRVAKAYGQKLPADYIAGLEKMFAYDMWIMQPDGNTPDWNDSDHCGITSMMSEGAELLSPTPGLPLDRLRRQARLATRSYEPLLSLGRTSNHAIRLGS